MNYIKTKEEFNIEIKKRINPSNLYDTFNRKIRNNSIDNKVFPKKGRKLLLIENNDSIIDGLISFKKEVYNHHVKEAYSSILLDFYISEEILKDNIELFDPEIISKTQKLSEDFIEEFSDILNWEVILLNQDLSYDFLKKHKNKLLKAFEFETFNNYEKEKNKYKTNTIQSPLNWIDSNYSSVGNNAVAVRDPYSRVGDLNNIIFENTNNQYLDENVGFNYKIIRFLKKTRMFFYKTLLAILIVSFTIFMIKEIFSKNNSFNLKKERLENVERNQ